MLYPVIEKTIDIYAAPGKVWRVFTDPVVTREMGGEYVSDWKRGGAIGWKGIDGKMYTYGIIIDIEPDKFLKHELYEADDYSVLRSVITYIFENYEDRTRLYASETLNYEVNEQQLKDISEGWDYALQLVKKTAEKK